LGAVEQLPAALKLGIRLIPVRAFVPEIAALDVNCAVFVARPIEPAASTSTREQALLAASRAFAHSANVRTTMSSLLSLPRDSPLAAVPWRVPIGAALGCAMGVSFLLSLQFLTQDWVWANWPVDEVLLAWLYLLRDRLVVGLAITLLVWSAGLLPVASLRWRAVLLAGTIVFGALVGEIALRLLVDEPRRELGEIAARWSLVALSIAAMFYLWRNSIEVHARWQAETLDRLRGQQQLANAQLVALKNQIEPHFLFNTLATVRQLHRTEPSAGAVLLADFIDYLRRAMQMLDRPQVPLAQELALLRAYLAVIAVRMSGRLRIEVDVPVELMQVLIPPLVLATLVENAVKHGLTPAPEGGLLRIAGQSKGRHIEIVVEDTGIGAGSTGGSGIGLANARARLRTLYGAASSLRLETNDPSGVRAIVNLPRPTGRRR